MSALAAARAARTTEKPLTASERTRLAERRDRYDAAAFQLGREADDAMRQAYASDDHRRFRRLAFLACSRYAQAAIKTAEAEMDQATLDRGWTS